MTECKYNSCSYALHQCMTLYQVMSPAIWQQAMDTESGGLHSKNGRVILTQVGLSQLQLIWPTTNVATASLLNHNRFGMSWSNTIGLNHTHSQAPPSWQWKVSPLHSGEPWNKSWDSISVNMFTEIGDLIQLVWLHCFNWKFNKNVTQLASFPGSPDSWDL